MQGSGQGQEETKCCLPGSVVYKGGKSLLPPPLLRELEGAQPSWGGGDQLCGSHRRKRNSHS